ncbi:LexA family protein [Pseudomonas sp. EA_35y_Pfl2_R111]|uniref:LexA family protein n=1 Tax=Pseudomonas sp. EA_35y_Pfl2_R111 TaxID=3088689 RepID=UPI0030DA4A34
MGNATILGPLGISTSELPFFSFRIPAGFPSPAQDHLDQKLSLDELLDIDAPHTYLVRVIGDSMIGAGIYEDDILVVSKAIPAQHGDIVIAELNGETFVKRLTRQGLQYVLCSENPKYPPRFIMEGDELLVWGVVTANIRRHRSHA